MTDVRRIPWRLPEGFEGLKYFWDNFVKVLGEDIALRGGGTTNDDTELMVFFHGN